MNLLDSIKWKTVGIIRLAVDRNRRLDEVSATVLLKFCSTRLMPPKKKHMPRTRSKFESMLPIKEVLTMVIWPLIRARMETINSTAFLRQMLDSIKINKKPRTPPKSGVQKATGCVTDADRNLFGGITKHCGKRNYSDKVNDKYRDAVDVKILDHEGDGNGKKE